MLHSVHALVRKRKTGGGSIPDRAFAVAAIWRRLLKIVPVVVLLSAGFCRGFNPPVDERDGMKVSIGGVPESVIRGAGFAFEVTVSNQAKTPAAGHFEVFLNDDWAVEPKAPRRLEVPVGKAITLAFKATPGPRVVIGHYPVHAKFFPEKAGGSGAALLHPIAIFRTTLPAAGKKPAGPAAKPASVEPPLVRLTPGARRLDRIAERRCGISLDNGRTIALPPGWNGSESETGALCATGEALRGGIGKAGFKIHPPWHKETGSVWIRYFLALPQATPITFECSTAIRDSTAKEPLSDGVEFRVLVRAPGEKENVVFSRFSAAKTWQLARGDLSPWAGKKIFLTLAADPGPKRNTFCDQGYWAEPTLLLGPQPEPITEAEWQQRTKQAEYAARQAAAGRLGPGAFHLPAGTDDYGAAVIPGKRGLFDGVIAWSDGSRCLSARGLAVEIDGRDVAGLHSEARLLDVRMERRGDRLEVLHGLGLPGGTTVKVRIRIRPRGSGLAVAFDLPGAKRNGRGEPRFTRIALGPQSLPPKRVYAGFGNVIENPGAFRLRAGGFGLSTRHVGADYANGLSLLQAVDLFPDFLACAPERNLFSLEAHHDVAFLFVPGKHGAFEAARRYRDLADFPRGRGVKRLLGRMCLDQWGGDYEATAEGLEQAGRYGLTHAIFVKHVWQRWGYDYRLPDIYPPRHGLEPFRAMPAVCRKYGILFAPHDNYIDFYPDADAFSYDCIVFNAAGVPARAWYNRGRKAQSYRWLPQAFRPWLKANMRAMKRGFAPTGLFIDVFSAVSPFDYYDREGRFYSKSRTVREWAAAFDTARRILGRGTPMLSEAGHDGLIGSLDGAEADHYEAARWGAHGTAACRVPWHDMATHGRMILFAGGLGPRYSNRDPKHGYGTDDYLCNTVIGGRNPMCNGPFSRAAVMTYWLLHDVCDDLARREFEAHAFSDDSVYRQHTRFSGGAEVWTNRSESPWPVNGQVLPRYGFLVRSGEREAAVALVAGRRAAWSRSPGVWFADARPPFRSGAGRAKVAASVLSGEYLGNGRFRVLVKWTIRKPLKPGVRPFVHISHDKVTNQGEKIAHYGDMAVPPERFLEPGEFTAPIVAVIPGDSFGGEYRLRYGLYNPKQGGGRIPLDAAMDGSRAKGGKLVVDIENGRVGRGRYEPEPRFEPDPALNTAREILDFGPVATNGAFRLEHGRTDAWRLTPLPGSLPFAARLDLEKLGVKPPREIAAVEAVGPFDGAAATPGYKVKNGVLELHLEADAFAYRIRFR